MRRKDRLFELMQLLRDGYVHRAVDLAARLGVSVRTVYRDIESLQHAGVAVSGQRGNGYQMGQDILLPPLQLNAQEFEALNLGIAIVRESTDETLRHNAHTLALKIDQASAQHPAPNGQIWHTGPDANASVARGARHMGRIRAAITARQKLALIYLGDKNTKTEHTVRPLRMEYWGHVWALTVWCETCSDFRVLRIDMIKDLRALPDLFVDEPGKRVLDHGL